MGPGSPCLLAGGLAAAVVGLLALRFLMRLVRHGRFSWFAPYCLAVGVPCPCHELVSIRKSGSGRWRVSIQKCDWLPGTVGLIGPKRKIPYELGRRFRRRQRRNFALDQSSRASATLPESASRSKGFWMKPRQPRFRMSEASPSRLYPVARRTRTSGGGSPSADRMSSPPRQVRA